MPRKMPFTPLAQPGESPLSLLRRAAAGNGQPSTLRFAYALNPQIDHAPTALSTLARNPEMFRTTCVAAGIHDDDIARVSYERSGAGREDDLIWNSLQVAVGALTFSRAKACLQCSLEQEYAMSEWDHRAAVACARHQVLLDDECPSCHRPWTFNHPIQKCGCECYGTGQPPQISIPQQPAGLLNRLIRQGDQEGLGLLDMAWKVLHWWEGLGLRLSRANKAIALWTLHSGNWPDLPTSKTPAGPALHPRLALAPLLDTSYRYAKSLASRLLRQEAPQLAAPLLARQALPASGAMLVLGVQRVPFNKLVTDRHVSMHPRFGVSASSINQLLWKVCGNAHPEQRMVNLAQLRGGLSRRSLSKVVSEIGNGKVAVYSCDLTSGLESLQTAPLPPTVDASSGSPNSLMDAANRLGTNTESIRAVIRTGLLAATKGNPRSGVQWTISNEELDRFDATYVFASALAKAGGWSVTTFSSRLRSAGVRAISGPGVDKCTTYLFHRVEVAGVDLHAIATQPYRSPGGRKRKSMQLPPSGFAGLELNP